MNKTKMRNLINEQMMTFIASGKQITKEKPKKKREPKVVEIEVDHLPEHLKAKFFTK